MQETIDLCYKHPYIHHSVVMYIYIFFSIFQFKYIKIFFYNVVLVSAKTMQISLNYAFIPFPFHIPSLQVIKEYQTGIPVQHSTTSYQQIYTIRCKM